MLNPTVFINKIKERTGEWKWYHRVAFLLLDMIITFQLTAQILFMDVWQTEVRWEQIVIYLFTIFIGAIALFAIFFLIDSIGLKMARNKGSHIESKCQASIKRWILCIPFCSFFIFFISAYMILPDLISVSYVPTEITLTMLSDHNKDSNGYEMLLSKNAVINGTYSELVPTNMIGQWNTDGSYYWALAPGSSITFSFPTAEDIDLRFNKHKWSGIVEIEDGKHREKLDLYSDTSKDYLENYRVKSNIVSGLSKVETILAATLIGGGFAGISYLLIYATLNQTSVKLYQFALLLSTTSIWLLYLCAGNPGGMSIDTLNQFAQAKGTIAITDAHPALLTIYYREIFELIDAPIILSLVQISFFASIVTALLAYLSTRGISRKALSIFGVLFSAHIVNGIYATILWKDIPFTVCLLWLTFLLTKLGTEGRNFYSMGNIIQLVICIPLAALLRHNGIVVFIFIGIVLIGYTISYRTWKPAFTVFLSVLIFIGVKGPLYTNFEISPSGIYSSFSLIHGIAYTRLASGEKITLTDELMPLEDWSTVYEPYNANSLSFSEVALRNELRQKIGNLDQKEIIKEYIKNFFKHPVLLIKDRLFGCNLLWNSVPSGYNWRVTNNQYSVIVDNNSFGYYCRENGLTDFVNDMYLKSVNSFLSDMLIWRAGPYVSLTLILLFLAFEKKRYAFFLAALPLLGNSTSLLLAMAWQDYRYVYFAMVCSCFLVLIYFTFLRSDSKMLS